MLIGVAKPIPCAPPPRIAVLIPTTSPLMLSRGPPELPKLIAASVWMKFSNERVCSLKPSARPFAEMTPTVSVFSNWNGLPMAIAQSPLRMRSESPSGMFGRF